MIYAVFFTLATITLVSLLYAMQINKKLKNNLKKLNYWLKMAHDKQNEVNNLKQRINDTITKTYFERI